MYNIFNCDIKMCSPGFCLVSMTLSVWGRENGQRAVLRCHTERGWGRLLVRSGRALVIYFPLKESRDRATSFWKERYSNALLVWYAQPLPEMKTSNPRLWKIIASFFLRIGTFECKNYWETGTNEINAFFKNKYTPLCTRATHNTTCHRLF